MNRWNAKVIWGFGLILFGIALTARELELIKFSIFFPGWWTFFIIIPCVKSIVQRKNGIVTNIGLGLGLLLLLNAQDFVSGDIFGTLFIAILFLIVGISLIFKKPTNNHDKRGHSTNNNTDTSYDHVHVKREEYEKENTESYSTEYKKEDTIKEQSKTSSSYHGGTNYSAFFSANNYQYVNEEFRGATISSILGNVQLDLRNAIIYEDSVINVTCLLGGIDIYVPSNIRIINQCTAILAGVDSNVMSPRNMSENSYTIYIKGNCLLGGIEIK